MTHPEFLNHAITHMDHVIKVALTLRVAGIVLMAVGVALYFFTKAKHAAKLSFFLGAAAILFKIAIVWAAGA